MSRAALLAALLALAASAAAAPESVPAQLQGVSSLIERLPPRTDFIGRVSNIRILAEKGDPAAALAAEVASGRPLLDSDPRVARLTAEERRYIQETGGDLHVRAGIDAAVRDALATMGRQLSIEPVDEREAAGVWTPEGARRLLSDVQPLADELHRHAGGLGKLGGYVKDHPAARLLAAAIVRPEILQRDDVAAWLTPDGVYRLQQSAETLDWSKVYIYRDHELSELPGGLPSAFLGGLEIKRLFDGLPREAFAPPPLPEVGEAITRASGADSLETLNVASDPLSRLVVAQALDERAAAAAKRELIALAGLPAWLSIERRAAKVREFSLEKERRRFAERLDAAAGDWRTGGLRGLLRGLELPGASPAAAPALAGPAPTALLEAPVLASARARAPALRAARVELEPGVERPRVLLLGGGTGALQVNGKEAAPLGGPKQSGGVSSRAFLHPEDAGALVKVYEDRSSFAGRERRDEKLERLRPLSAAGAAPRLLESGESAVSGRGILHFYVQELVAGVELGVFKASERPLELVDELFGRLKAAGLALKAPGADWLLKNVVVAKDSEGRRRAYLLDGETEAAAEGLAEHYAMLAAALRPAAPVVERHAGKTKLSTHGGIFKTTLMITAPGMNEIWAVRDRHHLEGGASGPHMRLFFDSSEALLKTAFAVAQDPAVTRVQFNPDDADLLEKTAEALEAARRADVAKLESLVDEPASEELIGARIKTNGGLSRETLRVAVAPGADVKAVLTRHGLESYARQTSQRSNALAFKTQGEAAEHARALALDADVGEVWLHPETKTKLESLARGPRLVFTAVDAEAGRRWLEHLSGRGREPHVRALIKRSPTEFEAQFYPSAGDAPRRLGRRLLDSGDVAAVRASPDVAQQLDIQAKLPALAAPPAPAPVIQEAPSKPIPALDPEEVGLAARFVPISPGTFQMGSPADEPGRGHDETLHTVTLTRGFELQAAPVTQRQFFLVMRFNPSTFQKKGWTKDRGEHRVEEGHAMNANYPVESVSWDGAQEFLAKLNAMQDEYTYRLPTEAEWEYAAKAGAPWAPYPWSGGPDALAGHVHYKKNAKRPRPVGLKPANMWGLHDMLGNVYEWVHDAGGRPRGEGVAVDPKWEAPGVIGPMRIARGGSYSSAAEAVRPAARLAVRASAGSPNVGLRLVREPRRERP